MRRHPLDRLVVHLDGEILPEAGERHLGAGHGVLGIAIPRLGRLGEANKLMQQIVNGANKNLAAVEGGLSARVGDLQSVIATVMDETGKASQQISQQIADVARAYRVYYQKVPGKDGGPYLMDHSSILYLLDRNGRFVTHFTHDAKAEAIAAAVGKLL